MVMDDVTQRKKIIKDRFDRLELKTIKNGLVNILLSDNTYGVYIDNRNMTSDSFSINPNYFMLNYITIIRLNLLN